MKIQVRNLEVYYEEYGEGTPVVILHGFTLDHCSMVESLEPVFNKRKGWRRIYIDLPGHGQTPGVDWIRNSDDILSLVQEFIDAIIPQQRFLVIGLSYGGYLAQGLVYNRAEWIDGVLLIVPRVVSHPNERIVPDKTELVKDESFLGTLEPTVRVDFETVVVIQNESVWERYRTEILPATKKADMEFLERLDNTVDTLSFDVRELPSLFEKPTLILVGRQDHWVGYQDAWTMLEYYPRATFAVLDGAGHAIQMEQENLFNTLVSDWLVRVRELA